MALGRGDVHSGETTGASDLKVESTGCGHFAHRSDRESRRSRATAGECAGDAGRANRSDGSDRSERVGGTTTSCRQSCLSESRFTRTTSATATIRPKAAAIGRQNSGPNTAVALKTRMAKTT